MINKKLSLQEIVNQGKSGQYPTNWQVYHGIIASTGSGCGIVIVLILGCLALAVAFIAGEASQNSFVALLICFVVLVLFIGFTIMFAISRNSRIHAVMIVIPDAVAACNEAGEISGFFFENANSINITSKIDIKGFNGNVSSKTYFALDIYTNKGRYFKWPLYNYVEDGETIGKTIIAAYQYYKRQNP